MSAQEVTDKVVVVRAKGHELSCTTLLPQIWCDCPRRTGNQHSPDLYQVGHAIRAISSTDRVVATVYKAREETGYILLIIVDHGNAEQAINKETGNPHRAYHQPGASRYDW